MKFPELTHNAAGEDVAPRTREDWEDWVSATSLRGYICGNKLGDWLNRYGDENGFHRDAPLDERLDFVRFNRRKGEEFEDHVVRYFADRYELVTIAASFADSRNPTRAEATLEALGRGCPVVHQGVLWNPQSRAYGIPDFLIRSDVLDELFPDHLAPDEASRCAEAWGANWHYIVVDAKFTTLRLAAEPKPGKNPRKGSRPGEVGNDGSLPVSKAQLFLYNAALARLQDYTPRRAFLLGRGWRQQGSDGRGNNAMERLGPVSIDSALAETARAAVSWVRQVRVEGRGWRVLPKPTRSELRPPAPDKAEWPWKDAIRQVTDRLNDPIRLWQVGAAKRDAAAGNGITSWRDPRATPGSLGVHGAKTAPVLQAILDVNRTEGPLVRPARVSAAEREWREGPAPEFFVDFETVSDLNDDFSLFPDRGGQQLIFMVGCGHLENGSWQFSCFIADRLDHASEASAIESWFEHMRSVRARFGAEETPRVVHWSHAEQSTFEKAYNSACERHPEKGWAESMEFVWFDLFQRVIKAEPVVVRDGFGFGLKEIANAFHGHRLIRTSWEDSPVDGQGAMVGAWHCHSEAEAKGIRLADTDLMKEIRRYNEVDCRVMQEILDYLRANH